MTYEDKGKNRVGGMVFVAPKQAKKTSKTDKREDKKN